MALRTATSRLRLSERTSSRPTTLTLAITQQQCRRPPGAPEGRPDVPHDDVGQGDDGRALAAIGVGVLGFQTLRDGFHVGQRGLQRDAVLEPADSVEPVAAPPEIAAAFGVKRRPELGRLHRGEVKLPRQHSDDDCGIAIQDDRLAEDVLASSVPCLPRAVAEQDRAGRGRAGLRRRWKSRPSTGVTPRVRKKPSLTRAPVAAWAPASVLSLTPLEPKRPERAQDLVELLPVEVVGIGEVALRETSRPSRTPPRAATGSR